MDASEIHARRLNATEVRMPKFREFAFLFADGTTANYAGKDNGFRGVWLEGDLCCYLFLCRNLAVNMDVDRASHVVPPGSSAQRRRLRRLRSWWRHERQAVTAALASAQHHSASRGVSTATQTEAPVIEHVVPAPVVTHAAPAPVIEYVAPAPVIEYIAPAPAVTCAAPSQQLPPAYTMTTVTNDVKFDITGLVNPQFSTTAVEASAP